MTQEEKIQQDLIAKFADIKDTQIIKRDRRMFLDVPQEKFSEIFRYLVKDMQFSFLSAITGMDEGNSIAVIYHLTREGRIILSLRIRTSRDNPVIETVTDYFPSADAYERELMDLLGVQVEGLADGHRYPLPDVWPRRDYPLRKDWKPPVYKPKEEVPNA